MKRLKYKKNANEYVELKLLDAYEITRSSQEVSYSDLKCDFTGHTIDDLPDKYQEVQIVEVHNGYDEVKYFGYINNYNFNEIREVDEFISINITLLSPMKLATLRTFTAIGSYRLKNLIENIILSPLIKDGFTLQEIDITDRTISVNYLSSTVEYGLNDLSNHYNFWWFIDENKNIYIKDINKMLNSKEKYTYDDTHKIDGLQYLKPTTFSDNYANVINFSNVRVYQYSEWAYSGGQITTNISGLLNEQITTLKKDGQIDFKYPVDINKNNIRKAGDSYAKRSDYYGIYVGGTFSDNTSFTFYVKYDVENNSYTMSSNLGFDGDENSTKDFLLIRDGFFSNLITGFRYNNENKNVSEIDFVMSNSALVWSVNKFYNDKAINEKKGIISNTGIVELTVNMNEQWKTKQELKDIGISYMDKNSFKLDGEIEFKLDNNMFKVGDIIKIDKMLFNGKYIITQIRESFNKGVTEYFVICKNSNITDNYINLFRSSTSQESEDKTYQINILHYNEEGIKETFEVVQ